MKKIVMAAAFVVASMSANAQVYLGGGLSLHSEDPGVGDTKTTIKILPEIGYKLEDNLAIGIKLGYAHTKQGDVKTNDFNIDPYIRYTFARWNKVGFFGEAGFGYTHHETTKEIQEGPVTVSSKVKSNDWYVGVRPGISVDLTKNFTFLTKIGWLGYKSSKLDADGAKASTDFGLDLSGENLEFSLLYNF